MKAAVVVTASAVTVQLVVAAVVMVIVLVTMAVYAHNRRQDLTIMHQGWQSSGGSGSCGTGGSGSVYVWHELSRLS